MSDGNFSKKYAKQYQQRHAQVEQEEGQVGRQWFLGN